METKKIGGEALYNIDAFPALPSHPLYEFMKRSIDIVISLVALLVFAIPLFIVGLIIKLDSPGSAIYQQERLGKEGRPFMLYKFRTMHQDAEKDGAKWADKNDSRCTKIGAVLRQYRIDEFPQLINILKGDMSIVGPRPEREIFYRKFSEYIDGFEQRMAVKQGLTGLAQINGGYDLSPQEKLVYDLEYIQKRSLWLDITIIFRTVKIVFGRLGAR